MKRTSPHEKSRKSAPTHGQDSGSPDSEATGAREKRPATTEMLEILGTISGDLERLANAYRATAENSSRDRHDPQEQGTNHVRAFQTTEYARALLLATVPRAGGLTPPLPHVVVFGGTQVGKSTAVNVLAGTDSARVHHTAGFTRHAQAFIPPQVTPEDLFGRNPYPFARFLKTDHSNLSHDRLSEYCVETLDKQPAVGPVILWDAPDCDAVGSRNYLPGMVEALALADCVVYVTSGQKYAIRHVLEWVAELRDSGKPVVALLNMTPKAHQSDLLQSMQNAIRTVAEERATQNLRDASTGHEEPVPAVAFEFVPDGDSSILVANEYRPGRELRSLVSTIADQARDPGEARLRAGRAVDYLRRRLPEVTGPAIAESDARDEFQKLAAQAIDGFVHDYQANYLDDASNYDAFTLVGLEILNLLDPPIPGAKRAITAVRTVVGIPARLLVMGAKSVYKSIKPPTEAESQQARDRQARDMAAVRTAHEGLLNAISREVSKRATQGGSTLAFWKSLDWAWEKALHDIEAEFRVQSQRLEERHGELIRETANKIYTELARDPVKLNLLRTGRLSADAAAIVLSIKSGGHGDLIHSMVVAPIMLSLTEAACQMIADNHVANLREKLRSDLLKETRELGKRVYEPRLDQVASEAASLAGFSQIDGAALRSLPVRLQRLLDLLTPAPAAGPTQ